MVRVTVRVTVRDRIRVKASCWITQSLYSLDFSGICSIHDFKKKKFPTIFFEERKFLQEKEN